MILCAGLGTRLRPLSDWRPKPLVPVGDREALAHILDRVRGGSSRVVVNAHHRADDIRGYLGAVGDVAISDEPDLLGTAGGVAHARNLLGDGDVLVWNGDMLVAIDPRAIETTHRSHTSVATMVVELRDRGEGNVGLDGDGAIVRLRKETTRKGETRGADFLGVYMFSPSLRSQIPERGCLIADVLLPALRRGELVQAHVWRGRDPWFDIGSIDSYARANFAWLKSRNDIAWRGEGSNVGAALRLDNALIGYGARVSGEGILKNAIVWPGTELHVDGERANVIATPDGDINFE